MGSQLMHTCFTHPLKPRESTQQERPVQQLHHRRACSRTFAKGQTHAKRQCIARTAALERVEVTEPEEAVELSGASFHPIHLDGCELLLATTPDGRLDLGDAYVRDSETDIFSRPSIEGSVPEVPTRFLEMEWAEEYTGDTLLKKEPWRKVLKVYLVPILSEDPYKVNIEDVYSIDNSDRIVRKEHVRRATQETDPTQITLRIREDGLVIEENREMISDWDLVEEYDVAEALKQMEQARSQGEAPPALPAPEIDTNPRDPIDALNDDDREYDESFEDTPQVDQGY